MQGIDFYDSKRILKNEYCVTSTKLDHGTGCPWAVYAMKPYFRINKQWLPSDFTKVGEAQSISNRQRAFNQVGSNTRLFWSVTTNTKQNAKTLESEIHNMLSYCHAGDEVIGTELFKLTCNQTYQVILSLQNQIEQLPYVHQIDVYKNGEKANLFTRDWNDIPCNTSPLANVMYNELFREV